MSTLCHLVLVMSSSAYEDEVVAEGSKVSRILMEFEPNMQYVDLKNLIKYLHQEDEKVVTYQEWREMEGKTHEEILRFLQKNLPQRGEMAFPKFLKCLERMDQGKLAKDMQDGELLLL